MKYSGKILVLLVLFLCSCGWSGRERVIEKGESFCDLSDLLASQEGSCIHLRWGCEGGDKRGFRIERIPAVENPYLKKVEFTTENTDYSDCDVMPGITYKYSISLEGKSTDGISVLAEVKPLKDFEVLVMTPLVSFERVEFKLVYSPSVENPYDTDSLEITSEVITPEGRIEKIYGFYMKDYEIQQNESGKEVIILKEPSLRVRYLFRSSGKYIVKFTIKENGGSFSSGYYVYDVKSDKMGFDYVRVSSKNPLYFESGEGRWFFPVGFNIGWARSDGLFEFRHYIDRMSEVDANLFRMWMIKWSNAIEWTEGNGSGDYKGLLRYAQDNSARIDEILGYAEEKGVRLILTFGSYLEFTEGGSWNEGAWSENPYNSRNGGPCNEPLEFFTNDEAKRIYYNRLRYIVARWGYSPSIFAYEFFNETNAPFEWVSEMSSYLKKIDGNRHMVSTTYGDDRIFSLKNIDFTMAHLYGNPPDLIKNYPQRVNEITSQFVAKYNKPFLLAEFGLDWSRSDVEYDREGKGINFHNGIFASISSGGSGAAMLWWWDDYIDALNLYWVLKPVKKIINEIGDFSALKPLPRERISSSSDRLNIYGIASQKSLLLWIQNIDYSWYNEYNKIEYEPVDSDVHISGLEMNCNATVEYIDTISGEILSSEKRNISDSLTLSIEKLIRDITVVINCE